MTDEDSRSRISTGSSAGAVRRRGKSRPGSPNNTASFPRTWAARKKIREAVRDPYTNDW